jgi:hypothetical protein
MLGKAEARLLSNAAMNRRKLFMKAFAKDDFTDMNLDADDSEELRVLREPNKDDFLKKIKALVTESNRDRERTQLQEELDELEFKQSKEEANNMDLSAECQIAIARLGAEVAERSLWAEWVHGSTIEETDKPNQGLSTSLARNLVALDEANKLLRNALRDAKRDAGLQGRKSEPASEKYPPSDLCKAPWVPSAAVGNLGKAGSKLVAQAKRALKRADNCLHGPASHLVSLPLTNSVKMCQEIADAELELQRLPVRQLTS